MSHFTIMESRWKTHSVRVMLTLTLCCDCIEDANEFAKYINHSVRERLSMTDEEPAHARLHSNECTHFGRQKNQTMRMLMPYRKYDQDPRYFWPSLIEVLLAKSEYEQDFDDVNVLVIV